MDKLSATETSKVAGSPHGGEGVGTAVPLISHATVDKSNIRVPASCLHKEK